MNAKKTEEFIGCLSPEELRDWVAKILSSFGMDDRAAKATGEMLVEADIHGLQSHGVSVMLARYLILMERGLIGKGSDFEIIKETPTTALIDGRNNIGAIVAENATDIAINKAKESSVAWVSVNHSNHIGPLAHWCRKIISNEMIGIVMSNTGACMTVYGASGKTLGTNPISIGAPGPSFGVVLDMASSMTAMGKVQAAMVNNTNIPAGWGVDRSGESTTDPVEVFKHGALLPIGGHKGSGLAVMIEIMCAVLSGANYSKKMQPVSKATEPLNIGNMFGAIRIDAFMSPDEFYKRITEYIEILNTQKRLPDIEKIYLPGQLEFEIAQKNRKQGIAVTPETKTVLNEIAGKYSCPLPEIKRS
jgi:LDH2 family malate/lactate/ureidoglycolate dehydrogenase